MSAVKLPLFHIESRHVSECDVLEYVQIWPTENGVLVTGEVQVTKVAKHKELA